LLPPFRVRRYPPYTSRHPFKPIQSAPQAAAFNVATRRASADGYQLKLDWRGARASRTCAFSPFLGEETAMPALGIFVFQCAETDLYALTLYRSGDNLPANACEGSWTFRARLLMTKQSLETLPLDAEAAMADLKQHGFFLARFSSGIITFPR
jgi:hypothetical protein